LSKLQNTQSCCQRGMKATASPMRNINPIFRTWRRRNDEDDDSDEDIDLGSSSSALIGMPKTPPGSTQVGTISTTQPLTAMLKILHWR
jgi:hypothetical protein